MIGAILTGLEVAAAAKTLMGDKDRKVDPNLEKMFGKAAPGVDVAIKTAKRYDAINGTSLVEFTQVARVEPLVLLEDDLRALDFTHDLLQTVLSMFSGYYLQAVALTNPIGGVSVMKRLDPLNPHRQMNDVNLSFSSRAITLEDYQYGLPSYGMEAPEPLLEKGAKYAGRVAGTFHKAKDGIDTPAKQSDPKSEQLNVSDNIKELKELSNLAVGKMLDVKLVGEAGQQVSVPVTVRLQVCGVSGGNLVTILGLGKNNDWGERYFKFRAGQLKFWKDLIFCEDIIKQHRNALMHDKSGFYAETLAMRKDNLFRAAVSGKVSVADASAVILITAATAKRLERDLGGLLKDPKVRRNIFNSTSTMLLFVIDPEYERVTIYHRGMNLPTHLTVRDIKASNKKSGPDIGEILKAYQLGNAPSLY